MKLKFLTAAIHNLKETSLYITERGGSINVADNFIDKLILNVLN